jgi:hypothetical protein
MLLLGLYWNLLFVHLGVLSGVKRLKIQKTLKVLGARKLKGQTRIVKIGYGHRFLEQDNKLAKAKTDKQTNNDIQGTTRDIQLLSNINRIKRLFQKCIVRTKLTSMFCIIIYQWDNSVDGLVPQSIIHNLMD